MSSIRLNLEVYSAVHARKQRHFLLIAYYNIREVIGCAV